ncbi:MAG TPA: bifunctional diguanylate cyclase/phosphodiesterase [Gammaproteobacteria bacterium]|nr:bifunctional diguanylate cyclase/phosphodiesterase [Gammaproteobacteria bacterium]
MKWRDARLPQLILKRFTSKTPLVNLTHYDNLTALPNRTWFNEILNKTLNHASRHKKIMAVLLIDLDRFRYVNDAFSHAIGDLVLIEMAKRFKTTLRAGDVIARMDGDEFIILLNDITHAKFASFVAEKIVQCASLPFIVENHRIALTASIGISVYPTDGNSLEDLQRNAALAMHRAKQAGSGVFHYFTKAMNFEAHEHIQLEMALKKAINNHEFILHYQPKLNLRDGSIEGVEALIRWENPEMGLITPSRFIPLAEETGLIMPIGEWVLREACQTNQAWQTEGYEPISIAVNLSAKQFQHPNIAELVKTILSESGMDPKYLELEITETAVMEDVEAAITKLNDIKKMGVQISIDDFGTGYTSISYLKKFPINGLKIDQSFIKDIPENANNTAITSAIIALAHTLGMKVVAEGVETAGQLQYLTDNKCDIVQGYYLSRPLPEQKIVLQLVRKKTTKEAHHGAE